MKNVALFGLLLGSALLAGGCATPGYTASEHAQHIARNWDYEFKQATDDWDHLLLLDPPSRLTTWNVR